MYEYGQSPALASSRRGRIEPSVEPTSSPRRGCSVELASVEVSRGWVQRVGTVTPCSVSVELEASRPCDEAAASSV